MVTSLPIETGPSKAVLHPTPPTLDEDTIDDLLYFSRTGELEDLRSAVAELSKSLNRYVLEIPAAAVDPYSGNTCLHMAAANNHVDVVNWILSLEQPPLVSSGGPQAALPDSTLTAAATGSAAASMLPTTAPSLYLHTLLNYPNSNGNTPLHWACLNGHIEVVKALAGAGADPGVLNAAGHDCVYEAEVNDKSNVVEWVLEFAESLESGVGVVGEGEGEGEGRDCREKDGQQGEGRGQDKEGVLIDEGQGKEGVLGDEGRHHQSTKDTEAAALDEAAKDSQIAMGQLKLDDKAATIR
ncbi:hypothetical protein DRE_00436 [Drechslerella stenobrocha 248]|uniref:Uncharacterized protein n=1 Tax=Drechslerella stenobrocha 248 TaxID=1043628 RepID=W7I5M9_9PEZI|nr:hypothetical protein DRE_00436 [Drechslerella stenobrocha 248]